MNLKVKLLKWSAGAPVAMLNKETAKKIGAQIKDRIEIKTSSKKITTIIDTVGPLIKTNEIAVSSEIKNFLHLRKSQKVEVNLSLAPRSLKLIKKKLNKKTLSKKEIFEIIRDIVSNSLSEAEIALFVSAMYHHGMNFKETIYLIEAILESGNKLKLKNKLVADKHSIGGVAGNRTTPIIVSICAAAGLTMPKNSSRAITSAAGTADVIETIAKVDFSIKEIKKIIQKTNACLVWGGASGFVPADSKIIKIEKQLKIDPEAQLLASIMSKKLAVGSNYILIDIPYGKSAKVSKQKAEKLKIKFEKLGKYFHKKLKVVLTDGNQPIGDGIGPVLELIDVINILDPKKQGPKDLEEKSLFLAAQIFELTGKTKKSQSFELAKNILYSGKAFEKFKQIIATQRGDIKKLSKLKPAKFKKNIISRRQGKILEINNKKINMLARIAGCPTDKTAGIFLHAHVTEKIKKRQKLLTIYSESRSRLKESIKFYNDNKIIKIK